MANVTKSLIGLDDSNSITFKRINTSPEEYTNVHTILFNGDQKEFEISSESDGGFSKLVNAVSIDWQGAIMPNTATLLELPDITLNDTAQLIDIIERICAKLNNSGIPEPSEPTIVSISADSTDIDIDYLTTFTPVIKATYSDAQNRQLENSLFDWEISEADSIVISQNDDTKVVTGIKAGNTSLIATLKEDNTKSITFNINVKKIDINRVSITGISDQTIGRDYDGTPVVLQNVVLKWKPETLEETLTENVQYTVTYNNTNIGNVDSDVTATITFNAIDDTNYTGSTNKLFKIKHTDKANPNISWPSDTVTVQIGEQNTFQALTNPRNLQVTYSSSKTGVATIDANGVITLVNDGTTLISAIFTGNNEYNAKTVTYTLTVQPAAVIPEYYWYCGQPVEQGENTVQILENVYIPTINENSIVDETNEYSTLTGWRKITQSSYTANNPLYSPEMAGRNGVKSIYVDGFDSETGEKLNQSVEYYMLIPSNTNILVRDGFNTPQPIYAENVLINDIAYNIYKATARKCVYEIY